MSKPPEPKVSIVVLNWNGLKDTRECLNSLIANDYRNQEILVVDNASTGDDINQLSSQFNHIIQLIRNDKNYGFSKGNNSAIKKIVSENSSDYVLLLNNDTVVKNDFLIELVKIAEGNKDAAIVGPKTFFYDYYGRRDVICQGEGKIRWWVSPGYYHVDKFKIDEEVPKQYTKKVDWVSGVCLLINLRKINPLLNEKYFFGCEDVDKCLEAAQKKLGVYYAPNSVIWHKASASRQKSFSNKIKEFKTNFSLMKSHNHWWILIAIPFCLTALAKYILKTIK